MIGAFQAEGDLCLGFFAESWPHAPELPPGASVLEIGCAEADWMRSMRVARPDLQLTGVDWREASRPDANLVITGNILDQTFAPASFDAIVMVSVIEWIGVGHYDGVHGKDPVVPDADTTIFRLAHTWLKPSGWLYYDTPYDRTIDRAYRPFRIYDEASIETRLYQGQWREVWRQWFSGGGHPDGPYLAAIVRPS